MRRHAVIVGGGIAGLTAAYRLSQAGWHVQLLEASDELGGLARSVPMGSGGIERYYHFICGGDRELMALANELGLGRRIQWAPAPVGHWYEGAMYPLSTAIDLLRFRPLSVGGRLRMGLQAMAARRRRHWVPLDRIAAKEWLLRTGGREVYEVIWQPLLEMKFGRYYEQVSAAWIWHRIWRVGTSRRSLWRPDIMGYIQGGSAVLVRALADAIASGNGEIYLSCPAQAVYCCSGERRLAVASLRGELHADVLVLAVPLAIAARLTAAAFPQWSAALARIPTTAVVCGLFRLARHITSYFWVNINDKRVQLNGFIEYSNLNAAADTWGGEILYAPTYLGSDDSRLLWSDEKWTEWFSQNLSILCPDFGDLVTATVISRDLYAQPVCAPGFAAQVPPIHGPVPGLFLVEATQLYPSDRTISGMIGLATQAAKLATEHPLT